MSAAKRTARRRIGACGFLVACALAAPAQAQNLLVNGGFGNFSGLDGWTFAPAVTAIWTSFDSPIGGLLSGSVLIENVEPGAGIWGGSQCVPAVEGEPYLFQGSSYVPLADVVISSPLIDGAFFPTPDCSSIPTSYVSVNHQYGNADEWVADETIAVAPPGTQSIQMLIRIQKINGVDVTPSAYFDSLFIPEPPAGAASFCTATALAILAGRRAGRGKTSPQASG